MKEWKKTIDWKASDHKTVQTTVEHFTHQQSEMKNVDNILLCKATCIYLQGTTVCMAFFNNRSHPFLENLIQDYAENL